MVDEVLQLLSAISSSWVFSLRLQISNSSIFAQGLTILSRVPLFSGTTAPAGWLPVIAPNGDTGKSSSLKVETFSKRTLFPLMFLPIQISSRILLPSKCQIGSVIVPPILSLSKALYGVLLEYCRPQQTNYYLYSLSSDRTAPVIIGSVHSKYDSLMKGILNVLCFRL